MDDLILRARGRAQVSGRVNREAQAGEVRGLHPADDATLEFTWKILNFVPL
ncbi:hypothetical protein IFU08_06285 [Microbacterium sp. CFBP 8790]|uniref:hypothetical protein n=1 Tax=unclassified Microbacterium TaxID=2609290 RepID=UPI0017841B76|nr:MULTISPECIES: hypothetical protein [unclassified Microbacterium]MBD8206755.1 hypothetical protein [Microbacterium sp. CFBP 8801]MBD8509174.1 hypothetical protein [Microbacterium sp. CFBP 8790]